MRIMRILRIWFRIRIPNTTEKFLDGLLCKTYFGKNMKISAKENKVVSVSFTQKEIKPSYRTYQTIAQKLVRAEGSLQEASVSLVVVQQVVSQPLLSQHLIKTKKQCTAKVWYVYCTVEFHKQKGCTAAWNAKSIMYSKSEQCRNSFENTFRIRPRTIHNQTDMVLACLQYRLKGTQKCILVPREQYGISVPVPQFKSHARVNTPANCVTIQRRKMK